MNIQPIKLLGQHIVLEPLIAAHHAEFFQITQDERIWQYLPYSAIADGFEQWFVKALTKMASAEHVVYVVRRISDNQVIGSTRFYEIAAKHQSLKIGHTWYVPAAQGTVVNPEAKLLLLTQAFEDLNFNRVELMTDSRNAASRAAILKLGATQEGILRQHMILDNGYIRDSVVFSILKSEWGGVKEKLQLRIRE